MSLIIPQTALTDPPAFDEFTLGAQLIGGYLQITGNAARVEILYGPQGFGDRLPPQELSPGSYRVDRSPSGIPLTGLRAQNAAAGLGSVLGGYFWTESDPTVSFIGLASSQVGGTVVIPVVALADFPPASPSDGQTIWLDLGTVRWLMEFDAASGSWRFGGGPPLTAFAAGPDVSAGGFWTALAGGPSLSLPRDGSYAYRLSARQTDHSGGTVTIGHALFVNAVLQGSYEHEFVNTGAAHQGSLFGSPFIAIAGLIGQTAEIRYGTTGGSGTYGARLLEVWPEAIT